MKLLESHLYVYSSFYLHEIHAIRTIAIAKRQLSHDVMCRIVNTTRLAHVHLVAPCLKEYCDSFIDCDISNLEAPLFHDAIGMLKLPQYVTLFVDILNVTKVTLQIHRSHNSGQSQFLGLAVRPIHNVYNNIMQLIEFVELHRILGVNHFIFPVKDIGEDVNAVLDYYKNLNILTILTWNLPINSNLIHAEGQLSALHDCLYKSRGNFQFVIMVDLDEFIIPRTHETYDDFLSNLAIDRKVQLSEVNSFIFANAFFYLNAPDDGKAAMLCEDEDVSKLRTLIKTNRVLQPNSYGDRSKYVVNPLSTLQLSIHLPGIPSEGKPYNYKSECLLRPPSFFIH